MFRSRIFTFWFVSMLVVWAGLFCTFNDLGFLASHFHYPLIMVVGGICGRAYT